MKMNLKKRVLVFWLVICLVLVGFTVYGELLPRIPYLNEHNYDLNISNCQNLPGFETSDLENLPYQIVNTGYGWEGDLIGNKCCEEWDVGDFNQRTQDASGGFSNTFFCYDDNENYIWLRGDQVEYQIKTLKGYQDHDYVSNGKQWNVCDESSLYQTAGEDGITDTDLKAKTSQFLCAEIDDDYEFVQCCSNADEVGDERRCDTSGQNSIVKTRDFGERIWPELISAPKEMTTQRETVTFPSADSGDIFEFNFKNWQGANALEIFFTVEKNWDFELALIGLDEQVLFRERLVDFVVGEPGYKKRMHAIIPIIGWRNVEGFKIFFDTEDNETYESNDIIITRMFLRPANDDELKYCSDARYKTTDFEQVWIDDLDENRIGYKQSEPAGELACNNFGFNWTGSQCCGDDLNETYRGETYEDSLGGCWASEHLPNGSAIMEVSYNLSSENENAVDTTPVANEFNITLSYTEGYEMIDVQTVNENEPQGKLESIDNLFAYEFCCPDGWTIKCGDQGCWQIFNVRQCSHIYGNCDYPSRFTHVGESCFRFEWDKKESNGRVDADIMMYCSNNFPQEKTITVVADFSENPKKIDLTKFIKRWSPNSEIRIKDIYPVISDVDVYFESKKDSENELVTTDINDFLVIENNNKGTDEDRVEWTERHYVYSDWVFVVGDSRHDVGQDVYCPSGYHPLGCSQVEVANIERCEHQAQIDTYQFCQIANDCTEYSDHLYLEWDHDGTSQDLEVDLDVRIKCYQDIEFELDKQEEDHKQGTDYTFSCTTNTCDIPLAGYPRYRIENLHPEDYDLYFVDGFGEKTLIEQGKDNEFRERGNLQAVKVPLQVLFFNGSLWGCNMSSYMERDFIEPVGICEVRGESFCAGTAGWGTGGSGIFPADERDTLKKALKGPDISSPNYLSESCCPETACWNGTTCVEDMSGRFVDPQYNQSCIAGEWELTPPLLTWNKDKIGFCPHAGDCLVEPEGEGLFNYNTSKWFLSTDPGEKPRCIAHGQYILDNYCNNNTWESRTKRITAALLNLVNNTGDVNSYTLYCDNYSNAFYGSDLTTIMPYIIGPYNPNNPLNPYTSCQPITGDNCVNNFCILDYTKTQGAATGSRRVIATSLNIPIDDSQSSFLYSIGKTPEACNSAIGGQNLFEQCGNDDATWYSDELNSIVFASQTIEMNGVGFFQSIIDWFKNPIRTIINWIVGIDDNQLNKDYDFVTNATRMQYFYSATRTGGEKITAVLEEINQSRVILAKYNNFSIDMCAFVNSAAQGKGITQQVILQAAICNKTNSDYNVLIDDNLMPGLWRELTAGLTIT